MTKNIQRNKLHIIIHSDKKLVSKISRDFLDLLHENNIYNIDSIQIAFEEALMNAIVHGNNNDINKNIDIFFEIYCNKVQVIIENEGEGFDYIFSILNVENSNENIFNNSGRGIFLISLYTDKFYFENGGRRIILVKNF